MHALINTIILNDSLFARETDTQHCYCLMLSLHVYVIMLSCLMHETCLLLIELFCTCGL